MIEGNPLPEIDLAKCTRCGACVEICPENVLVMLEWGPQIASKNACTFCAVCEAVCPANAVRCEFSIEWE